MSENIVKRRCAAVFGIVFGGLCRECMVVHLNLINALVSNRWQTSMEIKVNVIDICVFWPQIFILPQNIESLYKFCYIWAKIGLLHKHEIKDFIAKIFVAKCVLLPKWCVPKYVTSRLNNHDMPKLFSRIPMPLILIVIWEFLVSASFVCMRLCVRYEWYAEAVSIFDEDLELSICACNFHQFQNLADSSVMMLLNSLLIICYIKMYTHDQSARGICQIW